MVPGDCRRVGGWAGAAAGRDSASVSPCFCPLAGPLCLTVQFPEAGTLARVEKRQSRRDFPRLSPLRAGSYSPPSCACCPLCTWQGQHLRAGAVHGAGLGGRFPTVGGPLEERQALLLGGEQRVLKRGSAVGGCTLVPWLPLRAAAPAPRGEQDSG